jgi:predicted dehydrogenase
VTGSFGGHESWGLDLQEDQLRGGVIADPDGYPAFYRQVVAAVRGEGPVPVDPADAVAVLEIIERAFALTR